MACKGWVTRASTAITKLLESKITAVQLSDAVDEFDRRMASLDDVQGEWELTFDSEADLLKDIESAANFRDKSRVSRIKAAEKLS